MQIEDNILEALLQAAGGNDQLALDVFFAESRFMRVYTYTCIYMHTHINTYSYVHIYTLTRVHVCKRVCLYVYVL